MCWATELCVYLRKGLAKHLLTQTLPHWGLGTGWLALCVFGTLRRSGYEGGGGCHKEKVPEDYVGDLEAGYGGERDQSRGRKVHCDRGREAGTGRLCCPNPAPGSSAPSLWDLSVLSIRDTENSFMSAGRTFRGHPSLPCRTVATVYPDGWRV